MAIQIDESDKALISESELLEIEKRCESATPGPWVEGMHSIYQTNHVTRDIWTISIAPSNGEYHSKHWLESKAFIAHSRTDMPILLKSLREVQAELTQYRDLEKYLIGFNDIKAELKRKDSVVRGLLEVIKCEGQTLSPRLVKCFCHKILGDQDA